MARDSGIVMAAHLYVVLAMAPQRPTPRQFGPPGRLLGPVVRPPGAAGALCHQPADSRGRLYPETESATRTCYSRDRDRIIHSTAFRRLKHKTQVFVQHEGDYYRTRLTHSLEVAQMARSLARTPGVDEDLAEAVALAHDLGHTPFGHAGEEALDAVTRRYRRLRPQCPCASAGDQAGASLCRFRRPQSDLGNPGRAWSSITVR